VDARRESRRPVRRNDCACMLYAAARRLDRQVRARKKKGTRRCLVSFFAIAAMAMAPSQ